ncbi:hypothetical protein AB4120_14865 [Cupriavidus sp. 2KB_3]|uniref:hypothetical protein n=1 Tax=Cupriavidus sp. 2KB_3 TaxID=3232980 RepID=UPI003F924D9F
MTTNVYRKAMALRTLRKIKVIAAGETPSAEDNDLAEEKLNVVHDLLQYEKKRTWDWSDMPEYAKEAYAMMAGFLCSADFEVQADPGLWNAGMVILNKGNYVPKNTQCCCHNGTCTIHNCRRSDEAEFY